MRQLITVILITLSFLLRAQADPSPVTETAWSDPVSGYQIRAMIDATNGIIHCQVRNATDHALICRRFQFGYVELISLEIQDGTNWSAFHPSVGYPAIFWNAIPGTSQPLGPGEIIKSAKFYNREFKYVPWSAEHPENDAVLKPINERRAARETLMKNLCREDTFTFDLFEQSPLLDYFRTHPTTIARVAQKLINDANPPDVLYTPAFKLDADFIQTCFQQSQQLDCPLQLKRAQAPSSIASPDGSH